MSTVNNKELYGALKQSLSGNAVIENLPILELDGDIDVSDVKEERLLKT